MSRGPLTIATFRPKDELAQLPPPGFIGPAQLLGRGIRQQSLTYDIEYLRDWSPLLDLKILLQSAASFFRPAQRSTHNRP